MKKNSFDDKLSVMAQTLLDTADDENRLAVFKAVSAWRLAMRRATKDEPDEDVASFAEMKTRLRSVT